MNLFNFNCATRQTMADNAQAVRFILVNFGLAPVVHINYPCSYNKCKNKYSTVSVKITCHTDCCIRKPRKTLWEKAGNAPPPPPPPTPRGLKLWGESRTRQVLLVSKKKIWGNHAFFRNNKASIRKKNAIHCFVFYCFFLNYCCLIISEKCVVTPSFLFGFQ